MGPVGESRGGVDRAHQELPGDWIRDLAHKLPWFLGLALFAELALAGFAIQRGAYAALPVFMPLTAGIAMQLWLTIKVFKPMMLRNADRIDAEDSRRV